MRRRRCGLYSSALETPNVGDEAPALLLPNLHVVGGHQPLAVRHYVIDLAVGQLQGMLAEQARWIGESPDDGTVALPSRPGPLPAPGSWPPPGPRPST